VNLTAGDQTLRIGITASGLNLNWLEFMDTNTALSKTLDKNNKIQIYQTATEIIVDFNQLESFVTGTNLNIVNMAGQTVYALKVDTSSNKKTISKSHFKSGIYIASYLTATGNYKEKFVIN
jgi:hypothetical protein